MEQNQQPQPRDDEQPEIPTQQWVSKDEYNKAAAAKDAAEQASQKKTPYGKLIKRASITLAVLIIAVIICSFEPVGELLPTITKEAGSSGRGYLPASPVIGLLYLAIAITICFQIGVGIAAATKNIRNISGKGLLTAGAIIVAIGILGGGPILFAPLVLIALITCNFNPCQGT